MTLDKTDLSAMGTVQAETEPIGWRPIVEAQRGTEILAFYPAIKSGQLTLPQMMAVVRHPTAAPRQPTHFRPLPDPPKE